MAGSVSSAQNNTFPSWMDEVEFNSSNSKQSINGPIDPETGKISTLEAKYSNGKAVMPASKLASGGSYAITDFWLEDSVYGDFSYVELPNYVDGAVYKKVEIKYPKLTLSNVKTLSKKKSSVTSRKKVCSNFSAFKQ